MKKKLGEVTMIQSNRINIKNKMHLNSFNGKKDTLCSKNFAFPESDAEPLKIIDGEIYHNHSVLEKENFCQKCLEIFIKHNE
jgi:hypothetical protein